MEGKKTFFGQAEAMVVLRALLGTGDMEVRRDRVSP